MMVYDERIYKLVLKRIKDRKFKPNNFSSIFKVGEDEIHYASSMEPHTDPLDSYGRISSKLTWWTVNFLAFDKNYRFVFYDKDNKLQVVTPEKDMWYTFRQTRRHGVIPVSLVDSFHKRNSNACWNAVKGNRELVMVFRFQGV